jgi:tetratricopeptide (TPR) repeat protein
MSKNSRPPIEGTFVVRCIALKKDYGNKDICGRTGLPDSEVSRRLRRESLDKESFEELITGVEGTPAEVAAATACWEGLKPDPDLTAGERDVIEVEILERSRRDRAVLKEMALRSRQAPLLDGYPELSDVEPALWLAAEQLARLKDLPQHQILGEVKKRRELQHWALCVAASEESRCAASRDLEEAAAWAQAACLIADRVQGPEGWRSRLQGMAGAVSANVLRVKGRLKAARAGLEKARPLWNAGSDPGQILDPGLLLDLEASLCRDERRFEEALARLEEAIAVGRCQERYLIKKGFTLEVIGEYERAVEALLSAKILVDQQGDERLLNILHHNLSVNYCHVGRYLEAAELTQQVRQVAVLMGDAIGVLRATWLDGRIAAGVGKTDEALGLLHQARRQFASRQMWYDVALALLEIAALLLDQGRVAEVKVLTSRLAEEFKSRGVHREALAALRLFQTAVKREVATADFARLVLRFLFRARHDRGLRLSSC